MKRITPENFVAWCEDNEQNERAMEQSFVLNLCDMLGVERPDGGIAHPLHCLDMPVAGGVADYYKQGCFVWEHKKPGKNLEDRLRQAHNYAMKLENPPLIIASDWKTTLIRTRFLNAPTKTYEIKTRALLEPHWRHLLFWAYTNPEQLRPNILRRNVTPAAA